MIVAARHIAPEVARHLDALPDICRRHHVTRLDLFGSAVRDDFDPARSDVDVIVVLERGPNIDSFQRYFALVEDLERLFDRQVDVVEDGSIKNPYIIPRVEEDRLQVFP